MTNAFATLPSADQVKLAVSVCSNRPMEPRCALGLAMMVHHLTAFQVPFALITRMQASLLPQARQECQDEAIADGCTHQLWWDDDIEPPHDAPLRMLQTMQKRPEIDVIAANYCRKQDELKYTAYAPDEVTMIESYGKIGLEEAGSAGLGLAMVKLEGVRKTSQPHFEIVYNHEVRSYQGEDRYFIKKLRAAGLRVFVDHGISNFCQHWGSLGYNFTLWNPAKERPYANLILGDKANG